MEYRLINRTDFPSHIIKELIEFSTPKGVENFVVTLMDETHGAAWWGNVDFKGTIPHVRIYIAKGNKYPKLSNPINLKPVGYSPVFEIRNDEEAIISVLAHELRHVWQKKVSKRDFWKTSKICQYILWDNKTYQCLYSVEKDACKYAKEILNKYRNK